MNMDNVNNSIGHQQISLKQMDYKNKPLNVNYDTETFERIATSGNVYNNQSDVKSQCQDDSEQDLDTIIANSDEIKCIFLCKFHATAGPVIAAQVPQNYISKELFDTVSSYIIPKVQLQRSFLSV